MIWILRQAFDRRDAGPGRAFERHHTRARRVAVDMDSAAAALGDAAAIFRARQSQMVAQHPQQRRRWVGVDALVLPVNCQIVWHLINPEVTVEYDIDIIDLICQTRVARKAWRLRT